MKIYEYIYSYNIFIERIPLKGFFFLLVLDKLKKE